MRITIVGCGTIGSKLAKAADKMDEVKRIYLIDIVKTKAEELASQLKKAIVVESVEDELYHCDLVIEAARQDAAKEILLKTASRGVDIMVTSVGALVGDDFREMVFEKARSCDAHIFIPSGALFGTDGLRAASNDELAQVSLEFTAGKSSLAHVEYLEKKGIDINAIDSPTEMFRGTARDAVKLFPRNVNIAATVAILGVGFDKTEVVIIFDPAAETNNYVLTVEGRFGKAVSKTSNVYAPDSPSTSNLSSLSAIAALKRIVRNEWAGI